MTTVGYYKGLLIADSCVSTIKKRKVLRRDIDYKKILRTKDGWISFAGSVSDFSYVVDKIQSGSSTLRKDLDLELLYVKRNKVWLWTNNEMFIYPLSTKKSLFIGSGQELARESMIHTKNDMWRSMRTAICGDPGTSGDFLYVNVFCQNPRIRKKQSGFELLG